MPVRKKSNFEKSEGGVGHALPAMRTPDSTGRTAPNQHGSSALSKMRGHFHHERVGVNLLNQLGKLHL